MKIFKFLTILLVIIFCHTCFAYAAEQDRGLKPVSPQNDLSSLKRTALVIGNGDYKNAPLLNSIGDAKIIARTLKNLNFQVDLKINLDKTGINNAVRSFTNKLKTGYVGLFFFAGHGFQVRGKNFLIPIGADINEEEEIETNAVNASMVVNQIAGANNPLNIVILDACRNNPFLKSWSSDSIGLTRMNVPRKTKIIFSAKPGSVASDGFGQYSPFTRHFIKQAQIPGLELETLIRNLTIALEKETNRTQSPWAKGTINGSFFFKPHKQKPRIQETKKPPIDNIEQQAWNLVKNSRNISDFEEFLKIFPHGKMSIEAHNRIKAIKNKQKQALAKEKPPKPIPEPAKESAPKKELPIEQQAWNLVKNSKNISDFEEFLKIFPNGKLAGDARSKIKSIKEQQAWNLVKNSENVSDLQKFIRTYPHGKLAKEARSKIKILRDNQENNAWNLAKNSDEIADLQKYIKTYPGGKHIQEAQNKIKSLMVNREKQAWNLVKNSENISDFQEFINIFPDGKLAQEAQSKIASLQEQEKEKQNQVVQADTSSIPKGELGHIKVNSNVPGAIVYLDGKVVGKTPAKVRNIIPGEHIIKVAHTGYKTYEKEIDIEADEDFEEIIIGLIKGETKETIKKPDKKNNNNQIEIKCSAENADLSIVSEKKWKWLWAPWKKLGKTPYVIQNIDPGKYRIKISKSGYSSLQKKISVAQGEKKEVYITLEQQNEPPASDGSDGGGGDGGGGGGGGGGGF